jgi:hypothetical protein
MAAKWDLYFGSGGLDFSKSIWWACAVLGAWGGRKYSRIWGLAGGMVVSKFVLCILFVVGCGV